MLNRGLLRLQRNRMVAFLCCNEPGSRKCLVGSQFLESADRRCWASKYMMEQKTARPSGSEWEANYRERLIPMIYKKFTDRGQTREAAEEMIAGFCFAHPALALRRFLDAR